MTSTMMMTMTELIRRKIEKHRRHEAGKRNLANWWPKNLQRNPKEKEKEKGRSLTSPGDPLVLNYNYIKPNKKSADFKPKVCGKYAL